MAMMTDREKLIELLRSSTSYHTEKSDEWVLGGKHGERPRITESMADYLLANGVTFARKKRQPANLVGKCGSCAYAEPRCTGRSGVVRTVTCTNEEHLKRHKSPKNYVGGIAVRDKTRKACKCYVPKED